MDETLRVVGQQALNVGERIVRKYIEKAGLIRGQRIRHAVESIEYVKRAVHVVAEDQFRYQFRGAALVAANFDASAGDLTGRDQPLIEHVEAAQIDQRRAAGATRENDMQMGNIRMLAALIQRLLGEFRQKLNLWGVLRIRRRYRCRAFPQGPHRRFARRFERHGEMFDLADQRIHVGRRRALGQNAVRP